MFPHLSDDDKLLFALLLVALLWKHIVAGIKSNLSNRSEKRCYTN